MMSFTDRNTFVEGGIWKAGYVIMSLSSTHLNTWSTQKADPVALIRALQLREGKD